MLKFGTTNIEISFSQTSRDIIGGSMRDSMVFVTHNSDYAVIEACFSDGAEYRDEITVDGNTVSTDLSNY